MPPRRWPISETTRSIKSYFGRTLRLIDGRCVSLNVRGLASVGVFATDVAGRRRARPRPGLLARLAALIFGLMDADRRSAGQGGRISCYWVCTDAQVTNRIDLQRHCLRTLPNLQITRANQILTGVFFVMLTR